MVEYLKEWLDVLNVGWTQVIFSLLFFVLFSVTSLLAVRALLLRLPATYFCHSHPRELWTDRHPIIRWAGLIAKNLLGLTLAMLGVVLTLPGIPGPGVLTFIIGVLLIDFPGKKRVERRLIARPTVLSTINRLREKHGRPPLVLD